VDEREIRSRRGKRRRRTGMRSVGGGLGFGGPFDVPDIGMQGIASQHAQATGISGLLGGAGNAAANASNVSHVLAANCYAVGDIINFNGESVVVASANPHGFTYIDYGNSVQRAQRVRHAIREQMFRPVVQYAPTPEKAQSIEEAAKPPARKFRKRDAE